MRGVPSTSTNGRVVVFAEPLRSFQRNELAATISTTSSVAPPLGSPGFQFV